MSLWLLKSWQFAHFCPCGPSWFSFSLCSASAVFGSMMAEKDTSAARLLSQGWAVRDHVRV